MEDLNFQEFFAGFLQFFFVLSIIGFFLYGVYIWARETLTARKMRLTPPKTPNRYHHQQRRYNVDGQVVVKYDHIEKTYPASVLNVSENGMFVNIYDHFPHKGEVVEFRIKLPNHGNRTLEGKGVVCWVRERDEIRNAQSSHSRDRDLPRRYSPAGFGMQFSQFDPQSASIFQHLMDNLKRHHRVA